MCRLARAGLLFGLVAVAVAATDPAAVGQDAKKQKKKAAKAVEPATPAGPAEDLSRVLPVFDPGSHTRPISATGFTPDGRRLVTVGQDFTVQVWATATGERLDLLRLPGYGREKGFDPNRWDVAAVSPDGRFVAVGGQPKFLYDHAAKASAPARLLLVDVPNRRVVRVQLAENTADVTALAFAADGNTLAVGFGRGKASNRLFVVNGLSVRLADASPLLRTTDCTFVDSPHRSPISALAFSPDGRRLAAGGEDSRLTVWVVPVGNTAPTLAKSIPADGRTTSLDWSPDGTRLARSVDAAGVSREDRGIELWAADGTRGKVWHTPDLAPVLTRFGKVSRVRFAGPDRLLFVANGFVERGAGNGTLAGMLDLTSGTVTKLAGETGGMVADPVGAVGPGGRLVAWTETGNTEAVIAPAGGGPAVRCGSRSQLPFHVGWSADPAKPGFAWTDARRSGRLTPTADNLRFGFDLARIEPLGEVRGADYLPGRWALGEWALEFVRKQADKDADVGGTTHLKKGNEAVAGFSLLGVAARTLVPTPAGPPLVAHGRHVNGAGDRLYLFDAAGKPVARLLPDTTLTHDLAASPDGRFLIATTGTHRLAVYRTDGSSYPLLSFAILNGEWVCWTPEGYYAASPGGEKLFGWAVSNGPNALVTFHPAERFAATYRRPEVIRKAVELGSVAAALAALKSGAAPSVETLLPPAAKIELVEQRGGTVKVRASAAGGDGKPVAAMRVLLDGRPLPDGKGVWTPGSGPAVGVFEVDIPGGAHEVKVLARGASGAAVSDPLIVRGPKAAGTQPTLHRVCVGVNEYDDPGLKLAAAAKDAADFHRGLGKFCVGPDNRFGSAKGELLTDQGATRPAVLAALKAAGKAARPGDLLVVFFAGHGVKQGDGFYLLTREAKAGEPLKGKAVSGDDLRSALATVECPVLLVLDACHSAVAARSLRPATDDLTRALTDDSVGVTVLAAAMSHEVAGATAENGHFTAGLLKGLAAGAGVPFDPYERQMYVHHLYAVAFSEVRRATGGKQNPFLNLPWTAPPLVLREVSR